MFQILRTYKPDIFLFYRCYGSKRNRDNYYETLRIPQNSTQKEIRQAFITLSKEMHPDMTKNKSHTEFVKVNEAYNVLSKAHTRRQYDMDLKYNCMSRQYSDRVVYTNRREWEDDMVERARPGADNSDRYYGINGIKRVSNIWIGLLCLFVSMIGCAVQLLMIRNSMTLNRENLLEQSEKYQEKYNDIVERTRHKTREELVEMFKKRMLLDTKSTNPNNYTTNGTSE